MKLNKKKLIALGLSALMCVSPLSSVAFAEELSDGSAEEVVVVEEELGAEEIEAELPVVEDTSTEVGYGWVSGKSYWMFVLPGDTYKDPQDEVTYSVAADGDAICVFYLYPGKEDVPAGTKPVKSQSVKATKTDVVEKATCAQDAGYTLVANLTVDKQPIDASRKIITVAKETIPHTYAEKDRQILTYPTCTTTGTAYVNGKCTVCGKPYEGPVEIPALGHKLEAKADKTIVTGTVTGTLYYDTGLDGKKRVEENATVALGNTKVVDGKVVLIDTQKDGYYAIEKVVECTRLNCNYKETVYDIYEILAETEHREIVTKAVGVYDPTKYEGQYYDPTNPLFKNDTIEMANCLKDGYFEVTEYVNTQPVSVRTIPIKAHHMETRVQIEFDYKNSADGKAVTNGKEIANQFTVIYTKDGYKISNNHCTNSYVYYEVVHCTAHNCPTKEAASKDKLHKTYVLANQPSNADVKTATINGVEVNLYEKHLSEDIGLGVVSRTPITKTPDGDHLINKKAKDAIDAFYAKGKNPAFTFASLKAFIKDNGWTDVKIGKTGNEDEDHDYVIVEYYCNLCGVYHVDEKYLVPHEPKIPVEENRVEPTCYSTGSYDAVTYCAICGKELRRRPMVLPKIKHENQIKNYATNKVSDDLNNVNKLTPKVAFVGDVVVAINGVNEFNGAAIAAGKEISGKNWNPATTHVIDNVNTPVAEATEFVYIGVKADGKAGTIQQDYNVKVRVYTDCGICNNHKIDLTGKDVKIKVVSVSENSTACYPGTITLQASYYDTTTKKTFTTEQTFPYFTSINDYQARADHKPGKATVETIDGNKFMVTRCSVCGTILDKEAVEPEKTDLTASDVNVVLGQTVKALVGTNSTGELTYKVADEQIATVDSEGVIRGVNYGSTTVTVNLAAKDNFEAKEATFVVTVRPQPTVIWQLRDEGDGTMVVRWRTIEGVDGVQFAYATDADFSDAKYSAWTISNTQRRYGLEAATYYVKARTYVLGEDGKRIYSTWCTPKSISLGRYLPAPASMWCEVKANGSVAFKVAPSAKAEGYQISYDNGVEEKTSSAATAEFTRKLGTGSFTVKVRAYAYAEDGKYYSAWTPVGTVTIQ